MPEFHAEPYLYLPTVTHKSALIAWGAFYFRATTHGLAKLVDDQDLRYVHPPRKDSIGACSAPYGPARVEVSDREGRVVSTAATESANHCWVAGLQPDTEYRYKVFVKGQEWAAGERWDWSAADQALVQTGGRYDNRFRTNPDPALPAGALAFAAMGDFGVGVKTHSAHRRQQQVADALRHVVNAHDVRLILTTGDNIYAGRRILGLPIGGTGDEDDDWFFTYFQPYRYIVNRVPVYPSIGNHDAQETEERDDRTQARTISICVSACLARRPRDARRLVPACSTVFATVPTSSSSASTRRARRSSGTGCSRIRSTGNSSITVFRVMVARAGGAFRSLTIPSSAPAPSITTPAGWNASCRCSNARACE